MKNYPIEITEKRTVKRITVQQSMTDFLDAFNVERGLVYTVKMLFKRSGSLIRFYLTEGRYKIVNAFRLLIISTAFSLILLSFTDSFQLFYNVTGDTAAETSEMERFMNTLFTDWYNLILWLSIPAYATCSFLLLKKYEPFNYAEHMVIQSFLVSVSNILIIVFLPFGYLIGFELAFAIAFFVGVAYYFYMFSDLYRQRRFGFFLRVLLAFLLGNMFYFIFIAFGLVALLFRFFGDK